MPAPTVGIQDPVWLASSARLLIGLMPKPPAPPRIDPLEDRRSEWNHAWRACVPFFLLAMAIVVFTVIRDSKGLDDAPGISDVPSRSCR